MTIDLTKLRALAEAATPGPWNATAEVSESQDHWVDSDSSLIADTDESPHEQVEPNCRFIAAAHPDAVLELIDEVERLSESRDHTIEQNAEWKRSHDELCQQVMELTAEVERLRAQVLTSREHDLCDWGLGVLSSDYNDAPHDEIAALRERLKHV